VLWQGLSVLVVVLIGGFTTNFIQCLMLNIRNKTGYQYFSSTARRLLKFATRSSASDKLRTNSHRSVVERSKA